MIEPCRVCGSESHIELCVACRKPVCPCHRTGIGALSDGYACIDSCLSYLFGFSPPRSVPQETRLKRLWRLRYRAPSIVYYAIGVILGIIIFRAWR